MNAVSQRIKVKMSKKADVQTSLEEEVCGLEPPGTDLQRTGSEVCMTSKGTVTPRAK